MCCARVDALPRPRNTLPLLANLTAPWTGFGMPRRLQSLRVAYDDRVASATGNQPEANTSPRGRLRPDCRTPTPARISCCGWRARDRSIVEISGVGDADFLRNDASVRVLLDSLNDVNRDREAYAALGGPDARYAAMTARLATFGQRLLLIAEQRLTSGQSRVAVVPSPAVDSGTTLANDSLKPRIDTTMLSQGVPFSGTAHSIVKRGRSSIQPRFNCKQPSN